VTTESTSNLEDPETYAILGAAFAVHGELGCGFLEAVYHEALDRELGLRGISHDRERVFTISYRGAPLDLVYRADLVCFGEILVEIKALTDLSSTEFAQVLNYLKASGFSRALLINFGRPRLQYKRIVLTKKPSARPPS
jgi:GxxExxY protein